VSLPPNPDDPRPDPPQPDPVDETGSSPGPPPPPPAAPPPTQPEPTVPTTQQQPALPPTQPESPVPPILPATTAEWPQQPPTGPPTGPPMGPPTGPPTGGPPLAGPPGMPGVPLPTFGSSPGNRVTNGGSGRTILIAVVSVLALVAAGFAVVNLQAGGQAGAESPEAAVEEMFGAIADEDAIGVMEEMVPAERDVLRSWFEDLESNLSELGILDDVDLGDVGGVDLEVEGSGGGADVEVDGLQTSSEEVMPGVSRVTITGGRLSFETVPDAVPVGDVLEGLIEANGGEVDIRRSSDEVDFAEEAEDEYADPVFLVANEVDGRWYLSLSYTIAEYARLDSCEDVPAEGSGVAPQGAASAEEAASEFLTAAADLDVERVISLLPPDSMGALQQYAPLFLDDAEEEVEEMIDDEGYEASVDGLEFDTAGVDGGTRVVPTAGTGTFTTDDGDVTVSIEDRCIEATGDVGDDMEDELGTSVVCQDDLAEGLGDELTEEEQAELEELGALFTDYEAGLVVVERDGAYYVDPLRTFSDLTLQLFDGVDRADLEEGGILYRVFTGESVLFEDDYDDYDDEDYDEDEDYDDEDYDDEDYEEDEDYDDEDVDDYGADYDAGADEGYDQGLLDGSDDAAAGASWGESFDDTPDDIPADVVEPEQYELGFYDGYFEGYEMGYGS
jgi:hypothetical protein